MIWKPVSEVFSGGSNEAKMLIGKRINVRYPITEYAYDTVNPRRIGEKVVLAINTQGFISGVPEDNFHKIHLAFPRTGPAPESLAQLARKPFFVFRVDWETLRRMFSIEV